MRISLRGPARRDVPMEEFFDGDAAPSEGYPGLVEINRLYWFDFLDWGPVEWDELAAIYEHLPGWLHSDEGPYWFGTDDSTPPVLAGSAEIAGVQIWGILTGAQWSEWEREFHTRVQRSSLPLYTFTED